MNSHLTSRRAFLRDTALGSVAVLGWSNQLTWAVEPSADTQPLKIVFYTDIHTRVEWETPQALALAAESINRHAADLVLCGGDMITDGYQSSSAQVAPRWDAYRVMHEAIRPAPVVILGNHDLVGVEPSDGSAPAIDPREDVKRQMNLDATYRSFDLHGYHFMLLDSVQVTADEKKYRGFIDDAQLAWIRRDLEGVDSRTPIVVVCHVPLLTTFFQATQGIETSVPSNRGVVNNREVLECFSGHNLQLVLQGHLHVNEMLRWRGTTFITGGAVCGKWWRGEWHGTPEGYGVLDLTPGKVDWNYHAYGWTARRPSGV